MQFFFVQYSCFLYHFSLQMLGRIRIWSFLVWILGKRPRSGSPTLFVVVALTFNIKGKKSTDATSTHIVHITQRTTAVNRHCVHTSIIVYFGAVADKNNSILLLYKCKLQCTSLQFIVFFFEKWLFLAVQRLDDIPQTA